MVEPMSTEQLEILLRRFDEAKGDSRKWPSIIVGPHTAAAFRELIEFRRQRDTPFFTPGAPEYPPYPGEDTAVAHAAPLGAISSTKTAAEWMMEEQGRLSFTRDELRYLDHCFATLEKRIEVSEQAEDRLVETLEHVAATIREATEQSKELIERVAKLERQPRAVVSSRVDVLSERVNTLEERADSGAALGTRLDGLVLRVEKVEEKFDRIVNLEGDIRSRLSTLEGGKTDDDAALRSLDADVDRLKDRMLEVERHLPAFGGSVADLSSRVSRLESDRG